MNVSNRFRSSSSDRLNVLPNNLNDDLIDESEVAMDVDVYCESFVGIEVSISVYSDSDH